MTGGIGKDFYCSTGYRRINGGTCYGAENEVCKSNGCIACRRKWPTPEQYKEEYGEEYPDDGAVWANDLIAYGKDWELGTYGKMKSHWEIGEYGKLMTEPYDFIVCACTPFGKPDEDWRP